jgi:hypothetical protein
MAQGKTGMPQARTAPAEDAGRPLHAKRRKDGFALTAFNAVIVSLFVIIYFLSLLAIAL